MNMGFPIKPFYLSTAAYHCNQTYYEMYCSKQRKDLCMHKSMVWYVGCTSTTYPPCFLAQGGGKSKNLLQNVSAAITIAIKILNDHSAAGRYYCQSLISLELIGVGPIRHQTITSLHRFQQSAILFIHQCHHGSERERLRQRRMEKKTGAILVGWQQRLLRSRMKI